MDDDNVELSPTTPNSGCSALDKNISNMTNTHSNTLAINYSERLNTNIIKQAKNIKTCAIICMYTDYTCGILL